MTFPISSLMTYLMVAGLLLLQLRGENYKQLRYLINMQQKQQQEQTATATATTTTATAHGDDHRNLPKQSSSFSADQEGPSSTSSSSSSSLFKPGSLKMSRADAIRQCSVRHLQPVAVGCAYSPKYQFLLRYVGKTGSSTQRQVMKDQFEALNKGQNKPCKQFETQPGLRVVTTRDPVGRFMSSVKEMFFRQKVFSSILANNDNGETNATSAHSSMPAEYQGFYTILKGLDEEHQRDLAEGSTNESLLLRTQVFEAFLKDYDGKNAFDRHLELQMPTLFATNKGATETFDIVMDAGNLTIDLEQLAQRVNAPIPPPLKKRDSSTETSKSIAEDALSDAALQKVCQLVKDDLCCLNYEMPAACQKYNTIPKGQRVMCEWVDEEEEQQEMDEGDSKNQDSIKATTKKIRAVLV